MAIKIETKKPATVRSVRARRKRLKKKAEMKTGKKCVWRGGILYHGRQAVDNVPYVPKVASQKRVIW